MRKRFLEGESPEPFYAIRRNQISKKKLVIPTTREARKKESAVARSVDATW